MKYAFLMTFLLLSCTSTRGTNPIVEISSEFLGLSYSNAEPAPMKVFEEISGLNCMTYVETVMSIARPGSPEENLKGIRYYEAKTDEVYRKHFISADWLPHNRKLGFLKDITKNVYPGAKVAHATIDKILWFKKSKDRKVARAFEQSGLKKLLDAKILYIPIEDLIGADDASKEMVRGRTKIKINAQRLSLSKKIASKIPNGAILTLIYRDSEEYKDKIGSAILVGHIGFSVRKDGELFIRHADQPRKIIMDLPLSVFLNSVKKKFKGVNVSLVNI